LINRRVLASCLISGLVGPLFAAPAIADPPAPAGGVTIDSVIASGSSCRPGTVAVAISPDNTAFTVTYSRFAAEVGPGTNPGDSHAKCLLHVSVQAPGGYSFAVTGVDSRGYALLAAGASATATVAYRLQGNDGNASVTRNLAGAYDEDWQSSAAPAAPVFSPCGKQRKIDVTSELTVQASGPDANRVVSLIAMDSTDGAIAASFRLAWQRC
jgi:type 1 fimbria pilin